MARYRGKPVEAIQWTKENCEEVEALAEGAVRFGPEMAFLSVGTAFPSDFIVREGDRVRIYSQSYFEARYEAA